jgi:hypothetical protein
VATPAERDNITLGSGGPGGGPASLVQGFEQQGLGALVSS